MLKEVTMEYLMLAENSTSSVLGTVFYTICIFVAGAVIGQGLWKWVQKFLPWNK